MEAKYIFKKCRKHREQQKQKYNKKYGKIEKEFTQAKLSRKIFGVLSRNGQIPYGSMDIRCRKLTNSALFSVPLQSN